MPFELPFPLLTESFLLVLSLNFGANIFIPFPHKGIISEQLAPLDNILSESARVAALLRFISKHLSFDFRVLLVLFLLLRLLRVLQDSLLRLVRILALLHQACNVAERVLLEAEC